MESLGLWALSVARIDKYSALNTVQIQCTVYSTYSIFYRRIYLFLCYVFISYLLPNFTPDDGIYILLSPKIEATSVSFVWPATTAHHPATPPRNNNHTEISNIPFPRSALPARPRPVVSTSPWPLIGRPPPGS